MTRCRWGLNQTFTLSVTQSMVCSGSVAENPLLLQQGASSFGAGPQNSGMKIPAKDCKGHPISGLGTLV